jgi:hypothetical protein
MEAQYHWLDFDDEFMIYTRAEEVEVLIVYCFFLQVEEESGVGWHFPKFEYTEEFVNIIDELCERSALENEAGEERADEMDGQEKGTKGKSRGRDKVVKRGKKKKDATTDCVSDLYRAIGLGQLSLERP